MKLREGILDKWNANAESAEELARVHQCLDVLLNDIQMQQELAQELRIEAEQAIDYPKPHVIDAEMQKEFEAIVQRNLEAKFQEKIEAEDELRKWLLEEVTLIKQRSPKC